VPFEVVPLALAGKVNSISSLHEIIVTEGRFPLMSVG